MKLPALIPAHELPPIGSRVRLNSWSGVEFTVVNHGMFNPREMIHVRARVKRGVLSTSATWGEFKRIP